jgi:hypothetical protein
MAHVVTHSEHHGKTYHLTPLHPVPARLLGDIFEEAVGFYGVKLEGSGKALAGLTEYEQLFCELISVYSSYWKDDPTFDSTNTRNAAPHLPCPHIDRRMLIKMAEYAMRVNFTSPRAKPIEPKVDVSAALEPLREATEAADRVPEGGIRLGLRVTGHGGGDWTLVLSRDDIVGVDLGLQGQCAAVAVCEVDVFAALARDQSAIESALANGDLELTGDPAARPHIVTAFRQLAEIGQSRALASN